MVDYSSIVASKRTIVTDSAIVEVLTMPQS